MAKRKRRNFTPEFKAEVVLETLSSESSQAEGVLGRTDMLKDLSARSRKKKFISTPMTTSTKREPALGILLHRCIITNALTRR
ncbi:hypothetical protein GBAR_LOCUS7047 [Geodia barretti]|uniref:Transposase n=1 Tax=Geodia barretti TaxID=519541 RepID=A0AA35RFX3_GEOBA|nr:hypothetical protein GBAR_LOCUS7047 [Geodia barretti]